MSDTVLLPAPTHLNTPICMISDCHRIVYSESPTKNHCIYHHQLYISTRIPSLCDVPFCFNKCKVYGPHSTCVKHSNMISACCTPRCRLTCVEGSYVCAHHLESNYCSIRDCSNLEHPVDGPRCPKHCKDSMICCFENCMQQQTVFTTFCIQHYKEHRLCSTHGCFSPIFRNEYCCRHLTNPDVCFVLKCRCARVGTDGVCYYHSIQYFDYTPVSLPPFDFTPTTPLSDDLDDFLDASIFEPFDCGKFPII